MTDFLSRIVEFFANSDEVQGWGSNLLLMITTIGIAVIAVLEAWALFNQNKKIWRERSAASLSVPMFVYQANYFAASVVWGVAANSAAVVLNCAVLVLFYLPILVGLWKFKTWNKLDWGTAVVAILMTPLIVWLPWTDPIYLIFSFGTIYSIATMPWELWKKKAIGVFDIRLVVAYFISCSFWMGYAVAADKWVLKILNPPILIFLAIAAGLWLKYRQPPAPTI